MTKYNEVNYVDKLNLVCNTDHIEMVELGQDAQGLYSGKTRHGCRKVHDYELPGA